jgi:hypothetical protein
MEYFRAFIAGTVVPTIILPFAVCAAHYSGNTQILQIPFFHWLPVIWGLWNALYIYALKNYVNYALAGAILGLLVAVYAIFWLDVPGILGIGSYRFVPLVAAPILYAIVWHFLVKPLNHMLLK